MCSLVMVGVGEQGPLGLHSYPELPPGQAWVLCFQRGISWNHSSAAVLAEGLGMVLVGLS